MFYLIAIALGLALGALCLGIFISLRIFNFPDITADGSYTLGGVITAIGLVAGWSTSFTLFACIAGGMLAGMATGLIHTKMRLNSLLSGILVMTGLYSVNLYILGRSNLPIPIETKDIFHWITPFQETVYNELLTLILIFIFLVFFLTLLLKTDFGLSMRSSGNNSIMARSYGINSDGLKIIGLAMANGLIAISGFLVVQLQGFADINMGVGIVILGLGAVIIGESLMNILGVKSLWIRIGGVILGSIVFRLIISQVLMLGVDPIWIKLITAVVVILIVGLPGMIPSINKRIKLE
ncbi:MAG: ABC transporter permease [Saprospirales bacterium]|nr:MAG: ABC transporter permease [Saprospirales bacterium]